MVWLDLAVVLLGVGCVQAFRFLLDFDPALEDSAFFFLRGGLALQALFLAVRWVREGYAPVTNLPEILTLLALGLAVGLVLGRFKAKVPLLSPLFLPFIFLLSLVAALVGLKWDGPMSVLLTTAPIAIHIALTLLGYAFFTLGFGVGVTYWIQESQIKGHRMSKWAKGLPALELLDSLTVAYVGWGFAFWTAGLVVGAVQALKVWGTLPFSDPKTLGSLSVLAVYSVFFLCRWRFDMRGKKTMGLVLAGYFLALFTFVGVQVFLNSRHVF